MIREIPFLVVGRLLIVYIFRIKQIKHEPKFIKQNYKKAGYLSR